MNIALPFISLCHEQIGNMSTDVILVTDCISSEYLLEPVSSHRQCLKEYSGSVEDCALHSRVVKSSVAVLSLDHGDHFRH